MATGWVPERAGAALTSPSVQASRLSAPAAADASVPWSYEVRAALGPLLAHVEHPRTTDVFANGDGSVWVDRGEGAQRQRGAPLAEAERRRLGAALVALGGRHVDEAVPCADVRLSGGMRVHVVLPPIAVGGTALSIRIPRRGARSFAELAESGIGERHAEALREAIAERRNLLVTGAAGSGKTTLLGALLSLAPPQERIITIEDVAELVIDHPHHLALQARQANLEGRGSLGLAALLRESLRMRPDRLVLGECRGAEVRELLAALNTGHDGGAGTLHASSLADVPARLEALGALAGMTSEALARQAVSAVHLVVHLERTPRGRVVRALGEPRLDAHGRLEIRERP